MRADFDEKLLNFYFGPLDDETDRIEIEESLFQSREKLAEFIALKRSFEIDELPREPSRNFAQRLRREAKLKFARENRSFLKIWIPVGAVAVVLLIALGVFKMKKETPSVTQVQGNPGISFDSGGEAAVSLNFL